MNKKIKLIKPVNDAYVNIPVEIKWDFDGRDDTIDVYQTEVLKQIIGESSDFEILRFAHKPYFSGVSTNQTQIYQTKLTYEFNFYSGNPIDVTTSSSSNWVSSYIDLPNSNPWSGFASTQLYYYEKPFTKSFFKLDFYDTNTGTTQTNYFTVVLPVQQGLTESTSISTSLPNVQVKIPTMNLDYVGDKEGFFLYWLRKRDFLNIDTFYMTAKFFDARYGYFVRMMNKSQSDILPANIFQFDNSLYFYYKVKLDYSDYTYQIFEINNPNPIKNIKWYEYVNP